MTLVYEFFDPTVLGHLWFVAMTDGANVQLMPPTFKSEAAARIFEQCVVEHPSEALLTIDSQLELARRIERSLAEGRQPEDLTLAELYKDLPVERSPLPMRTGGPVYT